MAEHTEIRAEPRTIHVVSCDRCGNRIAEQATSEHVFGYGVAGAEIVIHTPNQDQRHQRWVICPACADQLGDWMRGRLVTSAASAPSA